MKNNKKPKYKVGQTVELLNPTGPYSSGNYTILRVIRVGGQLKYDIRYDDDQTIFKFNRKVFVWSEESIDRSLVEVSK